MRRTILALLAAALIGVHSIGLAQSNNTLRAPLIGDPTAWPINPPGLISDIMIGKTLFNNLVRFSFEDGSTVVADLASSWEVDADSRVWTFNLRQDVVWHDGVPFTSADVIFTVEAIRSPDIASRWSAAFVTLDTIEALDDHTVRLTFREPFAPLLSTLAYNLAIVPAHVLSELDLSRPSGPTEFVTNPIGTGPFRFVEQVSGSHFIVEANPDYHEGRAGINRVEFRVIPDVNAQVAQLLTGELDIAWTVQAIHYDRLAGANNILLNEVDVPRFDWLPLNLSNPLFQDVRVRQAMTMALDRETMVSIVFGGFGEVATGPIPPSIAWVPREGAINWPYDPERAIALLGEAGWTRGADGLLRNAAGETFRFTLLADRGDPTRDAVYLVTQDAWSSIGMDIQIETTEWNTVLARYRTGDYDARVGWWVIKPDPDLYDYFHTNGALNQILYSNPVVDDLLERGRAIADEGQRAAIYAELQEILAEEQPSIILYYPTEVRASNLRVQGLPNIGFRDSLTWLHLASLN
jgi:peptide/nickel transport system substrate-binding protein